MKKKKNLLEFLEQFPELLHKKITIREFVEGTYFRIKVVEGDIFVFDKCGKGVEWHVTTTGLVKEKVPNNFWRKLFCLKEKEITVKKTVTTNDLTIKSLENYIENNRFTNQKWVVGYVNEIVINKDYTIIQLGDSYGANTNIEVETKMYRKHHTLAKRIKQLLTYNNAIVIEYNGLSIVVSHEKFEV